MSTRRKVWNVILKITKALLILVFKLLVLGFYIISSLAEVILKNINTYIKQKI